MRKSLHLPREPDPDWLLRPSPEKFTSWNVASMADGPISFIAILPATRSLVSNPSGTAERQDFRKWTGQSWSEERVIRLLSA